MFHLGAGLLVCLLVYRLEARSDVTVAKAHVGRVHRGVAVEARARLRRELLSLRELLVGQHVRVAALFAEVMAERIARPEIPQAGIFIQARLGDNRARVRIGRRMR